MGEMTIVDPRDGQELYSMEALKRKLGFSQGKLGEQAARKKELPPGWHRRTTYGRLRGYVGPGGRKVGPSIVLAWAAHEESQRIASLVGRRLRLWWDGEQAWFDGQIDRYDPRDRKTLVLYDDGDSHWERLDKERWQLLGEDLGEAKEVKRQEAEAEGAHAPDETLFKPASSPPSGAQLKRQCRQQRAAR